MKKLMTIKTIMLLTVLLVLPTLALSLERNETKAAEMLLKSLGVKRGLIINADDLGMELPVNKAIFNAWDAGIITSISLQTVEITKIDDASRVKQTPFEDALKQIAQRENVDIGCHLTLNSSDGFKIRPVLPAKAVPSLVDKDGYFKENQFNYLFASKEEIKAECRAQIEKALAKGIELTHVDCHMPWGHIFGDYKHLYASIAGEYGLPARWPVYLFDHNLLNDYDVSVLNHRISHFITLSDMTIKEVTDDIVKKRKKFFLDKLDNLPLGISEVLCHPAVEGTDKKWRIVDYLVLTDKEVKNKIAARVAAGELALVGYHQVKAMMDEHGL